MIGVKGETWGAVGARVRELGFDGEGFQKVPLSK